MRLLLDTHIALCLAMAPKDLSSTERQVLADPGNDIALSAVSFWELRLKWEQRFSSGDRKGPADPNEVLVALRRSRLNFIPFTIEEAAATLHEPPPHRDPFDLLLLIQAQEGDRRLLTRDQKLIDHPLAFKAG